MANVPLKSIKFPGLDDTYTIPQIDASLATAGKAADAKATGDEIGSLKSAISVLTKTNDYSLDAPEMLTVPDDASEQHVTFTIVGASDDSKIVTNKTASGVAPFAPATNGIKNINVSNGQIENVTGDHVFILFHISQLTAAEFVIMGSTTYGLYDENGNEQPSRTATSTGWYWANTEAGFSTGYLSKNTVVIDYIVSIDKGELETRYPDITWDIATVIANFPSAKYGTLGAGETYEPQTTSGSMSITHNGTTTTYTGESEAATVYPEDVIAAVSGSVSFSLVLPVNFVKTVNNIAPDENGNVDISGLTFDGVPQIAMMLCKNNRLNYKGEATDTVIATLTPTLNDAYLYRTTETHGLYKEIVRDGDILYWDGDDWCTLRLSPSTFDLYETERVYDVVIVGGGAGGIGAAYALKDSGLKVCLIEALDSLGGTHVNAGVIQMLSSPAPDFLKTILEDMETNHADMVEESSQKSYGESSESAFEKHWRGSLITPSSGRGTTYSINPWAFSERYYKDLTDAGIDVLCGVEFQSLEQADGVVQSITVKNRHSGLVEKIWAFYYIDATSFGSLCTYGKTLDTDYYRGTDDRARFDESAIPQDYEANPAKVNNAEGDYVYEETSSTYDAPLCKDTDAFAASQGRWAVPNGISRTIKIMSTEGSDRSAKYMFSDYDRSISESKNRTKDHFKKYFGDSSEKRYIQPMPLLAMRETNRIKCEQMLTQDDLTTTATSQNYQTNHYVALASWHIDLHDKTGVNEESLPTTTRLCGLPYEAIIPKAYKNMLVASKCFGASHIALSYFRLTKSCMSIGYAAGKAVQLAIEDDFLDDLRNVDIDDLQEAVGIGDILDDIETYYDLSST